MTFGTELIQSAKEALAIAEGKAEPAAVYHPQADTPARGMADEKASRPRPPYSPL